MFQTTNQSWYLCAVNPGFPNFGIQRLSAQVDHLIDAAIRRFVQQKEHGDFSDKMVIRWSFCGLTSGFFSQQTWWFNQWKWWFNQLSGNREMLVKQQGSLSNKQWDLQPATNGTYQFLGFFNGKVLALKRIDWMAGRDMGNPNWGTQEG